MKRGNQGTQNTAEREKRWGQKTNRAAVMGENEQALLCTVQPIQKDSEVAHNQEEQLVEGRITGITVGKRNIQQAQKREKVQQIEWRITVGRVERGNVQQVQMREKAQVQERKT